MHHAVWRIAVIASSLPRSSSSKNALLLRAQSRPVRCGGACHRLPAECRRAVSRQSEGYCCMFWFLANSSKSAAIYVYNKRILGKFRVESMGKRRKDRRWIQPFVLSSVCKSKVSRTQLSICKTSPLGFRVSECMKIDLKKTEEFQKFAMVSYQMNVSFHH